MATTVLKPATVRNRIVEFTTVRAGDLVDHEGNWRVHPLYQREALEGRLEEVGITDVIKLYRSARNGGRLTVIDGHLRKSTDPDLLWPTCCRMTILATSWFSSTTHRGS